MQKNEPATPSVRHVSRQLADVGAGSSASDDANQDEDLLAEAPAVEGTPPGRVTAIDKSRLQTFNFRQATKESTNAPEPGALSSDELSRYVHSVLRFVPVEVAARYFERPLYSGGERAYVDLRHEVRSLEDQAYEHHFNAAVLFSDISGFTKLTNQLLRVRGDEGAEILNNLVRLARPSRCLPRSLAQSSPAAASLSRARAPARLVMLPTPRGAITADLQLLRGAHRHHHPRGWRRHQIRG